jgi:hypothetical protein
MNDFETLCASLSNCRKCRESVPEIGSLGESDFVFQWNPYFRGVPPLNFVFLGWEPCWPKSTGEVGEGTFNEPLLFAIREFLLSGQPEGGFMITNMAQCSMKTGSICAQTRDARFTSCNDFLKKLILLARGGATEIPVVSIGHAPQDFLNRRPDLLGAILTNQNVQRITHYGRRCNPIFRKFANDKKEEFDSFTENIRPRYEAFIHLEELHKYGQQYDEQPGQYKSDFERLFKWKYEMEGIRPS